MADSFVPYELHLYLRKRWRFVCGVCAAAVVIATAVSLLLPKQYTATVRILIEPPPGDQRVSVAVSPIYLESLRTYEQFATSDRMFLDALTHFGLRTPGRVIPIETWKRRVLKVEIARNTKVLAISVTLPDARKAAAMALYLAQGTVDLSRSVSRNSVREAIDGATTELATARERLNRATAAWDAVARQPTGQMSDEIASLADLRSELVLDLAEGAAGTNPDETRKQIAGIDRDIAAKQNVMAERSARADALLSERRQAEAMAGAAENRIRDLRATEAFHGEQLSIIDPGVTPESPSSPNIPLNVVAAFVAALAASLAYLVVRFGLAQPAVTRQSLGYKVAGRNG